MDELRYLKREETIKRGCEYCADVKIIYLTESRPNAKHCPYKECPYKELDQYENYGEYLEATDVPGGLLELLKE